MVIVPSFKIYMLLKQDIKTSGFSSMFGLTRENTKGEIRCLALKETN